jgi:chromodomain-helicase-DNA-binding protein 1
MAPALVDVSCILHNLHTFSTITLHYSFVTLFWPKKVKATKLEEIHAKMVMKESAPRTGSSDPGSSKKPRPNTSGKTNGPLSTPRPSLVSTNGKMPRAT